VPRLPPVASYLAAYLALGAVTSLLAIRAGDRALERFADRAAAEAGALAAELGEAVRGAEEDARFLAGAPQTRALIDGGGDRDALTALFLAFAGARRDVYQVRLLDRDGDEVVRVERRGDQVVESATLQPKGERYYVRAASALAPGQVYVSPLDLNVENGALEQPPHPTLRLVAPSFDRAGRRAGTVVINLEGGPLLDRVARARSASAGQLLLVDRDGVYLSHPDPARTFGGPTMLATGAGLDRDRPALVGLLADGARRYRGDGLIAASAAVGDPPTAPIVLVVASRADALAAEARTLVPLAIGAAVSFALLTVVLVLAARQRRLAAELRRETALRREIAAREETLRETQGRLVTAARMAALTESAAALAHELRNPLGAIVNSAQLLRRDLPDAESQELLSIVVAESERLDRAVRDFLDLARRPAPRAEAVDLAAAARDVVALARHEPALAGMAVDERHEASPTVRADPDEVRQVLWNLLLNAAAATRRAGGDGIAVRVGRGDLDGAPAGLLEVRDRGGGPPAAGDERPERAGLGLIVAAGIAARSGGRFELGAADGGGAIARVWLPAAGH
jgi:signal transduction histidine kinase